MPQYSIEVNEKTYAIEVDAAAPLLWVLRDSLNLVGTKYGCGKGLCGACTVHVDGVAMRSCSLPVAAVHDKPITTIEGLAKRDDQLHPLQQAWMDLDVPQCGYCQAGQIMNAAYLLQINPAPTAAEIDQAMAGNICRCGTYTRIHQAIQSVAGKGGKG